MQDKNKSISFILPGYSPNPVGGYKIVFEYANRLVADGYKVTIVYATYIPRLFKKKSIKEKLSLITHMIMGFKGFTSRKWFPLHPAIQELFPTTLKYDKQLEADIYVATACVTAEYVAEYPLGKKLYLIQGYEKWDMTEKELESTYALPLKKIVIAQWLHDMLNGKGFQNTLVKNGFDPKEYFLTTPITEKKKQHISILYHSAPLKGFDIALKAMQKVRQSHPIEVTAFGVYKLTEPLPEWIKFVFAPSKAEHLQINNEASIYVAASYSEGLCLTIGEAMMCGQAVVCTDIDGYREVAVNEHNALVSPVGDADALASSIIRLLDDDALRCRIAEQGLHDISLLNIDNAYNEFLKAIEL